MKTKLKIMLEFYLASRTIIGSPIEKFSKSDLLKKAEAFCLKSLNALAN